MFWYILSLILFLLAIALLIFNRIRERNYEKKKASETMREGVLEELRQEEEALFARRDKFRNVLNKAEKQVKK